MPGPLISIIVLNWNGSDCIVECIESIEQTSYNNFEIIVVDNASTDASPAIIKNKFPLVRLLSLEKNLGYAAGNNRGFTYAKGKYIATVNNDVVVTPDWLRQPIEFLENDPTVGIIACRQMNYHNHETIDCLYSYPLPSLLFQPMGNGKQYSSLALYAAPGYVIGAGGASAIYRKILLDSLCGFDERYYSYHEESDLCMRAFLSGWKCIYAPSAVVYHRGSFSFNRKKKQFAFYHERNRIWFIYKFYPFVFVLKNVFWILLMQLRVFRVFIIKRKVGIIFFNGIISGFAELKRFNDSRKMYVPLMKQKFSLYLKFRKYKKLPLNELS
jgi:GT2 family glycosyltransferase